MSPASALLSPAMTDKRDRILQAALILFAERGFHGTAIPVIASQANVGAGTIYRYFESKEALVNALYQREKQAIVDHMTRDFPWEAPARAQFHHFFRRVIAFAQANPASFEFLEHHHHAAYLDEASRELEARVFALVHAYLTQTAAQQITKPVPPPLLAAVLWGGICRLLKEVGDGHLSLSEGLLEQAEGILWEAIRL